MCVCVCVCVCVCSQQDGSSVMCMSMFSSTPTHSLLAHSLTDHVTSLLQGELVEDSLIQRSVTVQRISWHPSKQVLAMGWRSGEVTLCNLKEDQVWEQSSCHHGPIHTDALGRSRD